MGFEQEVLTDGHRGPRQRRRRRRPGPGRSRPQAENALTGALRSLFAVVGELPGAQGERERPLAPGAADDDREPDRFSRQHYNATVLDYNTYIATFPTC